jgi:hypothetical protein
VQRAFFDVIEGRVADELGWLTHVRDVVGEPAVASPNAGARAASGPGRE